MYVTFTLITSFNRIIRIYDGNYLHLLKINYSTLHYSPATKYKIQKDTSLILSTMLLFKPILLVNKLLVNQSIPFIIFIIFLFIIIYSNVQVN